MMKKMSIKILVSLERAVSNMKYRFCRTIRDTKQYFVKAEELFWRLLAGFVVVSFWHQKTSSFNSPLNERLLYLFFSNLPLLLDCHNFNVSWGGGQNSSGLSRQWWQSLMWLCCSLFALFHALEACTRSESRQNNNATSCNSFSSVLMKIKGLILWIHLGLTN